jgi:hypothetical protein
MSRLASTTYDDTVTELTSSRVIRPILLLKLQFDSADGGDTNYWSGIGTFTDGADSYIGAGGMARITTVKEESNLSASGARFELDGIPSANIANALGVDYWERKAELKFALVNASQSIIGDAVTIFSGRMDVMEIQEDGETATVGVTVENRLIDLERPKVRYYTNNDQTREFSGDKGLELVAPLNSGIDIIWGEN